MECGEEPTTSVLDFLHSRPTKVENVVTWWLAHMPAWVLELRNESRRPRRACNELPYRAGARVYRGSSSFIQGRCIPRRDRRHLDSSRLRSACEGKGARCRRRRSSSKYCNGAWNPSAAC